MDSPPPEIVPTVLPSGKSRWMWRAVFAILSVGACSPVSNGANSGVR